MYEYLYYGICDDITGNLNSTEIYFFNHFTAVHISIRNNELLANHFVLNTIMFLWFWQLWGVCARKSNGNLIQQPDGRFLDAGTGQRVRSAAVGQ